MGYPNDFMPDVGVEVHDLYGSYMWTKAHVVYILPKPGIEHTVALAKEQIKQFQAKVVENDKQYALICDIRQSDPIDKECRNYYLSDKATKNVVSFSFLVDSQFSMVMANFFIGLTTLKVKVKMFSSAPKAVNWSKNQLTP